MQMKAPLKWLLSIIILVTVAHLYCRFSCSPSWSAESNLQNSNRLETQSWAIDDVPCVCGKYIIFDTLVSF